MYYIVKFDFLFGNKACCCMYEILHVVNCNFSHSFDTSMGKKSNLEWASCIHVIAFRLCKPLYV